MYTKRIVRTSSSKSSTFPYPIQKITDHTTDTDPCISRIWLKYKCFGCILDRLFKHNHCSAYIYIPPVQRISIQCSGSPNLDSFSYKIPDGIDRFSAQRNIQILLVCVRYIYGRADNIRQSNICWSLPYFLSTVNKRI